MSLCKYRHRVYIKIYVSYIHEFCELSFNFLVVNFIYFTFNFLNGFL